MIDYFTLALQWALVFVLLTVLISVYLGIRATKKKFTDYIFYTDKKLEKGHVHSWASVEDLSGLINLEEVFPESAKSKYLISLKNILKETTVCADCGYIVGKDVFLGQESLKRLQKTILMDAMKKEKIDLVSKLEANRPNMVLAFEEGLAAGIAIGRSGIDVKL